MSPSKFLTLFIIPYLGISSTLISQAYADPDKVTIEAESGLSNKLTLSRELSGYSGDGYLTSMKDEGASLEVSFHVQETSSYHVVLRYAATYGTKINKFQVDSEAAKDLTFEAASAFSDLYAGFYTFAPGNHRIRITKDWGWVELDAIVLNKTYTPVAKPKPTPPKAAAIHPLRFEAEFASLEGAEVETAYSASEGYDRFTGLGFAKGFQVAGDAARWVLEPTFKGTAAISFRYRSAVERTFDLLLDGSRVKTLSFPASRDWRTVESSLMLSAPSHEVILKAQDTASQSLSLDHLAASGSFKRVVPQIRYEEKKGGFSYDFDASHSYSTSSPIESYSWDFGDGEGGEGIRAIHDYRHEGLYKVTLKARAVDGQVRYQQTTIRVGESHQKPRLIVCTDSEIDDFSTFIRYLSRSTDYETAGIVVGNSRWQKTGGYASEDNRIWEQYIDAYAAVYPNWQQHQGGWPSPSSLKGLLKTGQKKLAGMEGVGPGMDTEGSDHIVSVLLDQDPRPVWVAAWGGTDDAAQALYRIRETHPAELRRVQQKLKIFAVTFQDVDSCTPDFPECKAESGWWILKNFPDVVLIRSHFVGAINYQHLGHPYSDDYFFTEDWLNKNIKQNHGPLGASYPQSYFSEGDAAAVFFFYDNGLKGYENFDQGSWGGRYLKDTKVASGSNNFYEDAKDLLDGKEHDLWALARWLPEIQSDFVARMDWSVQPYHRSNHEPRAVISGELHRQVKPGELVKLDASLSVDPDDSDTVRYKWWQYGDADSAKSQVAIDGAESPTGRAQFVVPNEPGKELLIVLEVRDDGIPSLVNYQQLRLEIVQ